MHCRRAAQDAPVAEVQELAFGLELKTVAAAKSESTISVASSRPASAVSGRSGNLVGVVTGNVVDLNQGSSAQRTTVSPTARC